ncbi:MAG: metallophosphoesterase family protein [Bradymonadia bacterium]
MKRLTALALFLTFACSSSSSDRFAFESARKTQTVDELTSLEVEGGTFLTAKRILSADSERPISQFVVRAESLSPKIRVVTSDCLPQVFQFDITNTQTEQCTYMAVRMGEHAVDEASRRILDSLASTQSRSIEPDSTTLIQPSQCSFQQAELGGLQFSICADWSRGRVKVLPGLVTHQDCFQLEGSGTCIEEFSGDEVAVSSKPIQTVVELHPRRADDTNLVFAALANLPIEEDVIARLGASLEENGVQFVVLVGDLTPDGTLADAIRVKTLLDEHFKMPWFATLGDKDVGGNLGLEYLNFFGASSMVFESHGVRFVILDSADRSLKESESTLDSWLSNRSLDGRTAVDVKHLVFTHFPPFDGHVDRQFTHALEAGDFLARLTAIDALGLVVGEGGVLGVETLASLDLFRVGLSNESELRWTKFTYTQSCDAVCANQEGSCGCLQREVVTVAP